MILLAASLALATVLMTSSAGAHDWYTGLSSLRSANCCNNRDCRPVESRFTADGVREILVRDEWQTVKPETIVKDPSPDGLTHACWYDGTINADVRCVILPGLNS